jgi:hypothetical protein
MDLGDSGTMSGIDEEHPSPHNVPERRSGLAECLFDDGDAPVGLAGPRGLDVAVRPDRRRCRDEDLALVADGPAEADGRL